MKQFNLFFLMMLIGMVSFTSCSTENSELQVNSTEVTKGRIDRYERDGVELEVIEIVKKDIESTERRVRWCKNYDNPHTNPNGTGIAEVTLDDGSIHYAAANWENHGSCCGGLVYEVYYMGTSLPPNYSCK